MTSNLPKKELQKLELLRKVDLFEGLHNQQLDALRPLLQRKKFVRGDYVVQEQTVGKALYLVESGELKVSLSENNEREVILSFLKEGDFFGEMSLLDQKPHSANVIALKTTQLYVLQREDFLNYVEKYPKTLFNILQKVFERLRKADDIRRDLVLLDVYGRVARFLLRLADEEGIPCSKGIMIKSPPSQQQIAGLLGASRETINRVLSEFTKNGSIEKQGKSLFIRAKAILKEQVQDSGKT